MRIAVLEESVKSCEVECKASRETVLRLVSELDRERKKAANSAAALDTLKVVFKILLNAPYIGLHSSKRVLFAFHSINTLMTMHMKLTLKLLSLKRCVMLVGNLSPLGVRWSGGGKKKC